MILKYSTIEEEVTKNQLSEIKILVKEINQFNNLFRKKGCPKNYELKPKPRSNSYKGKEILSLIIENRMIEENDDEPKIGESESH